MRSRWCTPVSAMMALGLLAAALPVYAATLLGLEDWSGYRSRVELANEGRGNAPAMRWSYQIEQGQLVFAARSDLDPEQFRGATGIRISIRSDVEAPIFFHVRERDESTYQFQATIGSGWQEIQIPFAKLEPDPDSPDENGRLDTDQIGEIWIVDASGYYAPQLAGPRTVWVDAVSADGGNAPGGKATAATATAATAAAVARPASARLDAHVIPSGPRSASDNLKADPVVRRIGDEFVMWYGGNRSGGGQEIYRATSSDGENWKKRSAPVIRLGPRGSWDGGDVETPSVVKVGDTYHLYYCGRARAEDGDQWTRDTAYQIGHATSPDGIQWTKDPKNPVIRLGNRARNAWNWAAAAEPSVLYSSEKGRFEMWYVGINILEGKAHAHIGQATSTDGSSWRQHQDNPIIPSRPSSRSVEYNGYFTPAIVKDGDRYRIFYVTDTFNSQPSGPIRTGSSSDGISWNLNERTLVDKRGANWKKHGVFAPTVVADPSGIHLWYTGFAYTDAPYFGIGYARYPSEDVR